ncbi:MAG: amino acid permease [Myxococcales bacterium]|nr:amino acid permease [Myxococcales bacterium]
MDATSQRHARQALGLGHGTLVTVGAMVGSGVFFTPAEIARRTHSTAGALAVWAVGGLLTALGALSMAELGAALPASGGLSVWLGRAFGPAVGFAFGWTMLVVLGPSSVAFFASLSAANLSAAFGLSPRIGAPLVVLAMAAINLAGVTQTAWVQSLTTVARVLGLVVLAALALRLGPSVDTVSNHATAPTGLGLLSAVVPVLWAYDGWIDITSVGAEVRDPGRVVPRALLLGTGLVTALYLGFAWSLHRALGTAALAASQAPGALLGAAVAGPPGARLVSLLVALSTLGACLIGMLTSTRVVASLGTQLPRWSRLSGLSSRGTPDLAIVLTAALSLAYLASAGLGRLAELFVVGAWPFYALGALATWRLRKTEAALARPFRVPAAPWVLGGFGVATLAMVGAFAWQSPGPTLVSLGLVGLAWPLYRWAR